MHTYHLSVERCKHRLLELSWRLFTVYFKKSTYIIKLWKLLRTLV